MATHFAMKDGRLHWESSQKKKGPVGKVPKKGQTKRQLKRRNKKIAAGNKSHGHGRK